jgi:hypothetical protein
MCKYKAMDRVKLRKMPFKEVESLLRLCSPIELTHEFI